MARAAHYAPDVISCHTRVLARDSQMGILLFSKCPESIPQIALCVRCNRSRIGSIIPGHGREDESCLSKTIRPM
jgi:hypothetical protein